MCNIFFPPFRIFYYASMHCWSVTLCSSCWWYSVSTGNGTFSIRKHASNWKLITYDLLFALFFVHIWRAFTFRCRRCRGRQQIEIYAMNSLKNLAVSLFIFSFIRFTLSSSHLPGSHSHFNSSIRYLQAILGEPESVENMSRPKGEKVKKSDTVFYIMRHFCAQTMEKVVCNCHTKVEERQFFFSRIQNELQHRQKVMNFKLIKKNRRKIWISHFATLLSSEPRKGIIWSKRKKWTANFTFSVREKKHWKF